MTYVPGPVVPVERERDGDRWTLVFIRDLKHPRTKVWTALTDPEHLDAWSPFRPDRDLGTTGPATLTMMDGAESVDSKANITRADPPELLDSLRQGQPPPVPGLDGLRELQVEAAFKRSITERRPVLVQEEFPLG